jgi:hypothetical protein
VLWINFVDFESESGSLFVEFLYDLRLFLDDLIVIDEQGRGRLERG